jgi:peptide/nickel transport system permease protein
MSAPPAPPSTRRPTLATPPPQPRRRHGARPLGLEVWVGAGLLAGYVAVGLSALVEFRGSLNTLSTNPLWGVPFNPVIGPSWTHPFGVLGGLGTGLFTAIWQATPWDLAIVFSILALDAALGVALGGVAGLRPGGWVDTAVVFLADAIGSIPAVFLVTILFAGIVTAAPKDATLWVFVLLFGVVLFPTTARTIRERVRTVANATHVEAARASGAGEFRVLTRHILPYSLGPMLAQLPLDLGAIFVVLSAFTWFSSCVIPPNGGITLAAPIRPAFSPLPSVRFPEWGNLLGIGVCWGFNIPPVGPVYWWMFVFPLLAIVGLGLALGLLCDGVDKWLRIHP